MRVGLNLNYRPFGYKTNNQVMTAARPMKADSFELSNSRKVSFGDVEPSGYIYSDSKREWIKKADLAIEKAKAFAHNKQVEAFGLNPDYEGKKVVANARGRNTHVETYEYYNDGKLKEYNSSLVMGKDNYSEDIFLSFDVDGSLYEYHVSKVAPKKGTLDETRVVFNTTETEVNLFNKKESKMQAVVKVANVFYPKDGRAIQVDSVEQKFGR